MSQMIKIDSAKLASQTAALRTAMEKKLQATKTHMSDALRKTGIVVAEELGDRTFPGSNAIGIAVAAMRFDVSRVYATAGRIYETIENSAGKPTAAAFYAAWKRGDIPRARQILRNSGSPVANIIIGEPLNPALRESMRNKQGRVMSAYPLQLVTKEELAAFTKNAVSEIGKTASGWFACAEKLGGDGNEVAWKGTARHGSAGGSVRYVVSNVGLMLTITNHYPLARKHISPGQLAAIRQHGKEMLAEKLADSR